MIYQYHFYDARFTMMFLPKKFSPDNAFTASSASYKDFISTNPVPFEFPS